MAEFWQRTNTGEPKTHLARKFSTSRETLYQYLQSSH
ncbi:helix-turn-helix domain-containing protein [Pseudomonas sp. SDO528_S397]